MFLLYYYKYFCGFCKYYMLKLQYNFYDEKSPEKYTFLDFFCDIKTYAFKKNNRVSYIYDTRSDCRQSRLRNEVFATDFSVLDYVAANSNEKELNGVPIIPFL